jgi:hypothetical protein
MFNVVSNPTVPGYNFLFAFRSSGNGVQIQLRPDNKIYLWDNTNSTNCMIDSSLNIGQWYHVVFTFGTAGSYKTYVNGQTTTNSGAATNTLNTIARSLGLGGLPVDARYLPVSFAYARVFKTEMTAAMVNTAYAAAKASDSSYGLTP